MLVKFDLGNTNVVFSLDDENKENENIRNFWRYEIHEEYTQFLFSIFLSFPSTKTALVIT